MSPVGDFINYPRARQLAWTLERVFRGQADKPHLVLNGPPNNGTTAILCRFVEQQRAAIPPSPDITPHPVIYAPAPPAFDEQRFLNLIVLATGAPIPLRRRGFEPLQRQAITLIHALGTRMLIIDHADHLWPDPRARTRSPIARIGDLVRKAGLSLVIAGLHSSPCIDSEGEFAAAELPAWAINEEFEDLVDHLCAARGLAVSARLRADTIGALHRAAGGLLGEVVAVLDLFSQTPALGTIVEPDRLASLARTPRRDRWSITL